MNSTNTPVQAEDFPVITICNVNLVSRTRMKRTPGEYEPKTFNDTKQAHHNSRKIRSKKILFEIHIQKFQQNFESLI